MFFLCIALYSIAIVVFNAALGTRSFEMFKSFGSLFFFAILAAALVASQAVEEGDWVKIFGELKAELADLRRENKLLWNELGTRRKLSSSKIDPKKIKNPFEGYVWT